MPDKSPKRFNRLASGAVIFTVAV
ncbi:hypothetical protein Rmet_6581 [Cupriavidus metallidurans CH34]|uniref:Uncharacterized protein n=1 Tax=Cupriavidus metallidurans (strain ATCC 43123 / DSM 2839 / NBRC 102507 / CH34) TaxID=266264 RepID=D3DY12_CUPMC|nr:hypothetical protein Rmet_6581 [Cupriavidus metallidurans CH34]